MDRQNGVVRKSGVLRSLFFVLWVLTSTLLYAIFTLTICLFSRKLGRRIARIWNLQVLGAGGIKIRVEGKEKINSSERYVFMANHQSALDIPIMYAGIGSQISFIAKKELFMIPVFGWGMAAVGHIWIDRQNARRAHASIARAVKMLNRQNVSLILFPEGTRSRDGKVGDFKSASFSLALQAGVKLVPVAIKGAIDRLPPGTSSIVPGEVLLEIGDPIPVGELKAQSKVELCARVHSAIKGMVEGKTKDLLLESTHQN